MQRTIHFIPSPELISSGETPREPVPASSAVPAWYRDGEVYARTDQGKKINGMKTCVPFLDSLLMGYLIPLQCDVHVGRTADGQLRIEWDGAYDMVSERKGTNMGETIPRPAGHLANHLIWKNPWGVQAPRGYSLLWTHPLNRSDLPFTTLSAVVDVDKFYAWGNVPFFLNEQFEGTIPAGTPLAQVIPFKRSSWVSVFNPWKSQKVNEESKAARSVERGMYRDKWWTKKYFR